MSDTNWRAAALALRKGIVSVEEFLGAIDRATKHALVDASLLMPRCIKCHSARSGGDPEGTGAWDVCCCPACHRATVNQINAAARCPDCPHRVPA